MNRAEKGLQMFPDCPIRNILSRISDKWSLLIIFTIHKSGKSTMRFKELQRKIPDINTLIIWAMENMDAIMSDRKKASKKRR